METGNGRTVTDGVCHQAAVAAVPQCFLLRLLKRRKEDCGFMQEA
jgi:hypothetical protein